MAIAPGTLHRTALTCAACGIDVHLGAVADGTPGVIWALDQDGTVLERGIVGEGHTRLTRRRSGAGAMTTEYCAGPILPAATGLAHVAGEPVVSIDLTAFEPALA